jgi:putative membrane protein
MVAMGLLGALITLSSVPLYAAHFATTAPWGLTPLEDQQIGGLIMWAPASAVYLVAALSMVRDLVGREARA